MIGFSTLVARLSLNLMLSLVGSGQVAQTLTITGATTTTPIAVTCTAHGIPLGRVAHGYVSGVGGMPETKGGWVLTPADANTLTLSGYTNQGAPAPSVGVNAYTSGGTVQLAFPDYQILLGRRWIASSTAVVSPRFVFVPTDGKKWDFEPYGGMGGAAPQQRGTGEQQAEKLNPQLATQFATFEVYVTGAANPPQPDFGDFDATELLVQALYQVLWDGVGGARAKVLHESWPSQTGSAGSQTQRGQQWKGIVEFQMPVSEYPLSFVPPGTSLQLNIAPVNPGTTDTTTLTLYPGSTD